MRLLLFLLRLFGDVKDAWDLYAALALAGFVPAITVYLGLLEGQPWSVVSLYVMASMAFAIIVVAEGRPLLADAVDHVSRRRRPLEILWGHDEPFVHPFSALFGSDLRQYRLFRVAVRNRGPRTIDRVEVQLQQIEPKPGPDSVLALPLPLHLMPSMPKDRES